MYPKGTIYNIFDPRRSGPHGIVNLHAPFKIKVLYTALRGVGAGMIGFIIISLIFSFGPLIQDEIGYRLGVDKINLSTVGNVSTTADTNLLRANETSAVQTETSKLGINSYFSIVIPKIGAKANIIANVDPTNEKEYDEALMEGVAHAKGTYFPGQGKDIFLFSHSTNSILNVSRYNAIFYLLNKLTAGDDVVIYFSDKRYNYKVTETKIIGPDDTQFLTNNYDSETLILQTCYPPGTSLNRLLVFAKPSN